MPEGANVDYPEETRVHGYELEDILTARGIKLAPGDAVCVYAGRDAWQAANADSAYGRPYGGGTQERPGLHVSCLPFLRDHDVSLLVWDMLDHLPIGYDIPWAVHARLFAYGSAARGCRGGSHREHLSVPAVGSLSCPPRQCLAR